MVSSTPKSTRTQLEEHRALMQAMHKRRAERALVIPPTDHELPPLASSPSPRARPQDTQTQDGRPAIDISHIPEAKRRKYEAYYPTYCWDEETIRNDLPERYAVAGDWGNAIHGAEEERRCEEYPRQRRLLVLKSDLLQSFAHPPLFLALPEKDPTSLDPLDIGVSSTAASVPGQPLATPPISIIAPPPPPSALATHLLQTLGPMIRFDSIHIAPPPDMPWSEVLALPIRQISADVGFIFLWVGTGSKEGGLEQGREALTRWGFRKCEEIVWVKTNKTKPGGPGIDPPTSSIFQNTKEHCLMGIRGTVRRATDGHFVHTNIDTDVIVWEGDSEDSHRKPPEMYSLIENFCLGLRRLDLFGSESRARYGWVTAGYPSAATISTSLSSISTSNAKAPVIAQLEAMAESTDPSQDEDYEAVAAEPFDKNTYLPLVTYEGKHVLPTTNDIESLRPKSPNKGRPHSSQSTASTHLNNGASRPNSVSASNPSNLPSRPQSNQPMAMGGFLPLPGPSYPGGDMMMGGMMTPSGQGYQNMMGSGMPGMMGGGMGMGQMGMGMGTGMGMGMGYGAMGGMTMGQGGMGMGMGQQPFAGQNQQQQFAGAFGGQQALAGFPYQHQQQSFSPQYQPSMGYQPQSFGQQQYPQQSFSTQGHQSPMDLYQQQLQMQQMMMGQFPGGFGGGQPGQGGYVG